MSDFVWQAGFPQHLTRLPRLWAGAQQVPEKVWGQLFHICEIHGFKRLLQFRVCSYRIHICRTPRVNATPPCVRVTQGILRPVKEKKNKRKNPISDSRAHQTMQLAVQRTSLQYVCMCSSSKNEFTNKTYNACKTMQKQLLEKRKKNTTT